MFSKPSTDYLIVEGQSHLIRDNKSKAIINTDTSAYLGFKKQKQNVLEMKKKLNATQEELKILKEEFAGLQELVRNFIANK